MDKNESCPTCRTLLFLDPHVNLLYCRHRHGPFHVTCPVCESRLSIVNMDSTPMDVPGVGLYMRQGLQCPKGHGWFTWMDRWETRQQSNYFYVICTSDSEKGLMPFARGAKLDDDGPYYVSGDRAAINYIISEMKSLGFEEAWHRKGEPWYIIYFSATYPPVPKPPDWGQRMERVYSV